jgi:hypothetical protein
MEGIGEARNCRQRGSEKTEKRVRKKRASGGVERRKNWRKVRVQDAECGWRTAQERCFRDGCAVVVMGVTAESDAGREVVMCGKRMGEMNGLRREVSGEVYRMRDGKGRLTDG